MRYDLGRRSGYSNSPSGVTPNLTVRNRLRDGGRRPCGFLSSRVSSLYSSYSFMPSLISASNRRRNRTSFDLCNMRLSLSHELVRSEPEHNCTHRTLCLSENQPRAPATFWAGRLDDVLAFAVPKRRNTQRVGIQAWQTRKKGSTNGHSGQRSIRGGR